MASSILHRFAANPSSNCLRTKTVMQFSSYFDFHKKSIPSASTIATIARERTSNFTDKNQGYVSVNNEKAFFNKNQLISIAATQHKQPLFIGLQQQKRNYSNLQSVQTMKLKQHHTMVTNTTTNRRYISSRDITKNMTLYTSEPVKIEFNHKTLEFKSPSGNPLVLIMSWLLAKQKHLKKYAEIYTELGFDVMVVHITPWQLLWPVKGTQIVATETLKFLENNKSFSPIVVHGFSVGAYLFSEILLLMSNDLKRYADVLNRFVCQIWDSAADITEIPIGLPKAIFPKNPRMQNALRNYTLYHLKTFHNQATIHYMRSSQMFHSTILKKPALFFVSDNDPIGPPSSNSIVRDNWERANIKVSFKRWKNSLHAAHFIKHRDEYLEYLFKHLEEAGVLESIMKSRAKL